VWSSYPPFSKISELSSIDLVWLRGGQVTINVTVSPNAHEHGFADLELEHANLLKREATRFRRGYLLFKFARFQYRTPLGIAGRLARSKTGHFLSTKCLTAK
jgi:hypothetical protein